MFVFWLGVVLECFVLFFVLFMFMFVFVLGWEVWVCGIGDVMLRLEGVVVFDWVVESWVCGVGKLLMGVEFDEKFVCIWFSRFVVVLFIFMFEFFNSVVFVCEFVFEGCLDILVEGVVRLVELEFVRLFCCIGFGFGLGVGIW